MHQHLWLPIQTDTSAAVQHIQQSINGDKFQLTTYVDVQCNFQAYREKVCFYLMDNLPRSFLLGYLFLLDKGAGFQLKASTVILSEVKSTPTLTILPANNLPSSVFDYSGINSMFLNFQQQQQPVISTFPNFELLFQEFSLIFLESSPDIANVTSSDNKSILTLPVQEVLTRSAKLNSLGTKTASGVKSLSSVSPVSKSMDRIILVPPDFFVLPHTETESDAGNFKSTWPRKKKIIGFGVGEV